LLRWRHRFRFRQRGSTPQTWVKGGMAAADSCISARERTCGVVSSRFSQTFLNAFAPTWIEHGNDLMKLARAVWDRLGVMLSGTRCAS
jgi:hypothetical protein